MQWTGICIVKAMMYSRSICRQTVKKLLAAARGSALVAACLVVATGLASAATIYKSIDKDGNVIFTDQPIDGAESLGSKPKPNPVEADENSPEAEQNPPDALDDPNDTLSLTPDPIDPPAPAYAAPEEPKERPLVTLVEILTPIHNATLHDPIGRIWVELQSYPTPLKKSGLTAQLWMNDNLVNSGRRPMLSLPAPERGTHVLQVKLVDDNGRLFLQSDTVHLHVKHKVVETR